MSTPVVVRAFALVLLALIGAASSAAAQAPLSKPTEAVILTITGNIARGNDLDAAGRPIARFDRPMLEGLGVISITTSTPWHTGVQEFSGPAAAKVMNAVGANGKIARAVALNDYVVEIPIEDFMTRKVILATRQRGKIMEIREKGPVFVIYPFDEFPRDQRQPYFNRAAWQLATLNIQ